MLDRKYFMLGYFFMVGMLVVAFMIKSMVITFVVSAATGSVAVSLVKVDNSTPSSKDSFVVGMIVFGFSSVIIGLTLYTFGLKSILLYFAIIAVTAPLFYYSLDWLWKKMDESLKRRVSVGGT